MIAYVQGKIARIDPAFAIIDVNGIGYLVKITLNTYSKIREKSEVKLHTYFQVREDAQTLFGFAEEKEKLLFEQLISVSGVGGNTAVTILSSISADDLFTAIQNEDVTTLKRVKGIGAKTAGRIILELRDKISIEGVEIVAGVGSQTSGHNKAEALNALASLGFPKNQMSKKIDEILQKHGSDLSVEEIIKIALRNG
ncbi:MAG: Holliday junction branch migration protein RuvA [Bacteroidetes bacterium]|nr:Holliday junction branch migration protein RuvA [Bacteroidota bacterium]MCB0843871.1 Holliday junction branch migration protein RuvA [Bacteroidota bacterium]MCB0851491.1 Holliday junction branch migration protein RuvA [Bacteroidota bacterium]